MFAEGSCVYFDEVCPTGALERYLYNIDSDRDRNICLLVYLHDLKTSDVIALDVDDVKDNSLALDGRNIKIDEELEHSLKKLIATRKSGWPLFSPNCITRLTPRRVQQIIKSNTGYSSRELRRLGVGRIFCSKSEHPKDDGMLTVHDIDEMLSDTGSDRDEAFIRLIVETGITVGQALNLRGSDILGEAIRVPQTDSRFAKSEDICRISEGLSMLLQGLSDGGHIFTSNRGSPMTPRRAQQILSQHSEKVGKRVTPGIVRKTSSISKSLASLKRLESVPGSAMGGDLS